jgi:hypothetical protein
MSIVFFSGLEFLRLSARGRKKQAKGREGVLWTDQNDGLCGAVVVTVGPCPVGDLEGGHAG